MLIFGGNGFVGRHLSASLAASGAPGISVARMPDPAFLARWAPSVTAMTPTALDAHFDDVVSGSASIVYLASASIPGTFTTVPWHEVEANVAPLMRFAYRAMQVNPDVRFVYVSSGGTIYGDGGPHPIPETAPTLPISSYGYGKLAAEEALRFLGRTIGLNYAILRAANPVGRWQSNRAHGIVSVALRAALSGETLTLSGEGRQVRDFFDAADLAEAILRAAARTDLRQRTWNIGSGVGARIADVVRLAETVSGRPIAVEMKPARPGDVDSIVLDCTLVRRDLDWSAGVALATSMEQVFAAMTGDAEA